MKYTCKYGTIEINYFKLFIEWIKEKINEIYK